MPRLLPALLLFFSFSAAAETDTHRSPLQNDPLRLPEEIRALLNQEMQAIRKGMESLVFDVASGNWNGIHQTAQNMKNSYIMAQRLSEHQRHQLHDALPAGFQEIDGKFHHYAGMLSHVAEERDMDLVQFYVYKMNEACTSCHSRYAPHKFEGFAAPNQHMRHSH